MKYYRMLLKKPLRDFLRRCSDVFIDGKKVKCAHVVNGQPTVVFENGFCTGMSCMKYWDSAFLELASEVSLFAYDRSDKTLDSHEIEDIHVHLEETIGTLRTLLKEKGLSSPYILVGHSLGGLYIQYYAKKYPDEVAGLVLVDGVYPKESAEVSILDSNIYKIGQTIMNMPKLKDIPISILSATQEEYKKDNPKKSEMIDESIELQKEYAKLYPSAKQTWVNSGHLIQYEKPYVIVNAVRDIVKQLV